MAQKENNVTEKGMNIRSTLDSDDAGKLRGIMHEFGVKNVTEALRICINIADKVYVKKEYVKRS